MKHVISPCFGYSLLRLALVSILICRTGETSTTSRGLRMVSVNDSSGNQRFIYSGSHALVIGVSDYTAGWPKLESVISDVDQIEKALTDQGFHVEKVLNPNSEQLNRAFNHFIDQYGYEAENRLLFFFAGHGHSRMNGTKGYLVPADAPLPGNDERSFLQKAITMNQIMTWARELEAKHAIFIFDSCFSGTVFKSRALPEHPPHISDITAKPIRQFISAGSADEEVPAKSIFVPTLLQAISGKADMNRDGYVTGTELGLYVRDAVLGYRMGQTPQFGKIRDPDLDQGDFVFQLGMTNIHTHVISPLPSNGRIAPVSGLVLLGWTDMRYKDSCDRIDALSQATAEILSDGKLSSLRRRAFEDALRAIWSDLKIWGDLPEYKKFAADAMQLIEKNVDQLEVGYATLTGSPRDMVRLLNACRLTDLALGRRTIESEYPDTYARYINHAETIRKVPEWATEVEGWVDGQTGYSLRVEDRINKKMYRFISEGNVFYGPPERGQLKSIDAFYIQEAECTNRDFEKFCESVGWGKPEHMLVNTGFAEREQPVTHVTMIDALAFCKWFTKRLSAFSTDKWVCDLPTEIQWERAARLDFPRRRSLMVSEDVFKALTHKAKGVPHNVAHFDDDIAISGVTGLSSNVREWCKGGWSSSQGDSRQVAKGGCFFSDTEAEYFIEARFPYEPGNIARELGFRTVIYLNKTTY